MNKNSKTSSKRLKATFDSDKDTEKIKILVKAKMILPGMVEISLWDQEFEIGMLICPVEFYGINDIFYSILDKMLMAYYRSPDFRKVQKRKETKK
ncbi:MAG: hypothetical protein ACK4SF_08720 [Algoriphagus aquaeductus]|uniref:hypothetical protein n=1 Tax=Algoriphagus aquaeductus TaxID=475299 RepID=UPI00391D66B7